MVATTSRQSMLPRDAKLLLAAATLFSLAFMGVSVLAKVLFVLRLGATPEYVGVFNAVGALSYATTSIPAGYLGTRFGERKLMRIGGYILAVGLAMMPLSYLMPPSLTLLMPHLAQIVTISGWCMFNVNLIPAIMGYVAPERLNSALSVNAALRGFGTLVGLLFGGMLPGLFADRILQGAATLDDPLPYALALVCSVVLAMLGWAPLMLAKPAPGREGERSAKVHRSTPFPWVPVLVLSVHIVLSHGGWAMAQSFFNAYADTELHISAAQIGITAAVAQGLGVVIVFLHPRMAKRWSNGWVLMASTAGIALSQALLAAMPSWGAASVARWGYVTFATMWQPALQAFQMQTVNEEWRSIAFGVANAVMAGSFALSSLSGGYLVGARGSYTPAFWTGAIMCGVGVLVAVYIMARYEKTVA